MGRNKSTVLGHIALLHEAGYHVVAFDMRNHGTSGRDRGVGAMAARFSADLRDVLRAVRADEQVGGERLALLTFSFSTWTVLRLLADGEPSIAGVVCDSGPFLDIEAGLAHLADLRRPSLPALMREGWAFRLYRHLFRRIGGGMISAGNWPPDLAGGGPPLMFIGGAHDAIVPAEQVRAFAARYPGAEYWLAPNALHMSALRFDEAEYRARVLPFLANAFGDGDGDAVGPDRADDRAVEVAGG
jgi:pimeloyl-ACP methyl ester carboxylesterase